MWDAELFNNAVIMCIHPQQSDFKSVLSANKMIGHHQLITMDG